MRTNSSISRRLYSKVILVLALAVVTAGAFATSGDGRVKDTNPAKKSLLSINKTSYRPGNFSLSPRYNFRGSQVMSNPHNQYINLSNTPVSYQTGHTTYTVSLKKKVLNDKIVFNPNAATRN
jgi:hypothetical protein